MRSYDDTGVIFPTMKPLDMPKKSEKAEEKVEASAPAAVKPTGATGFVKPKGEHAAEEVDKVESEPIFEEQVDFDTFAKSDYRAVKIKECTAVPKSKKLLKFVLDDGSGTDRVILSGTKLRKFLSEGKEVPDHFGRPEVLAILKDYYAHLQNKVEIKMQRAASGSTM